MKNDRKTYDERYKNLSYSDRYSSGRKQRDVFKEFKKEVTQVEGKKKKSNIPLFFLFLINSINR